jgi:hypothetical protein
VRALAGALDTNRTLQRLMLDGNIIDADIKILVADRLRVNKLVIKVPAWVALAVARLTRGPRTPRRAAVLCGASSTDIPPQG